MKILKKILQISEQYFPCNNDVIMKIQNELFSYQIGKIKMYIFDSNDDINFLLWYWENDKNEFLLDLFSTKSNINLVWKYFKQKIIEFSNDYANLNIFTKNVIENANLVNIIQNYIDIVGINNFINKVILNNNKLKSFGIKKHIGIRYKFATKNFCQIII